MGPRVMFVVYRDGILVSVEEGLMDAAEFVQDNKRLAPTAEFTVVRFEERETVAL